MEKKSLIGLVLTALVVLSVPVVFGLSKSDRAMHADEEPPEVGAQEYTIETLAGIGETCEGDLNFDGIVNGTDVSIVTSDWGPCVNGTLCLSDIDQSGDVGFSDLLIVLSNWGVCEVVDTVPVANATGHPLSGPAPLNVSFAGMFTGGEEPYTFYWDFNDGTNATEQNPVHTFVEARNHTVSFTVTDADGDSDTDYVIVEVSGSSGMG